MCAERSIHARSSGSCFFSAASSMVMQISDSFSCSCMFTGSGHAACESAQNKVKPAAPANHVGRTKPPSIVEAPRPAEVAAAGNEKTQALFGRLGQSNADALADRLDLVIVAADPKLLIGK